jgi:type VII secretion integral membrane protein EccD
MEERSQHRTPAPVRLRFVLGDNVTDLALPSEVTLGDLLPEVLPRLDPEAADRGTEHDGWIVQRLGQPPLDTDRSPGELNLLDGETVHVRPRSSTLTPVAFDDLVAGLAEQVKNNAGIWTVARSQAMLLTFAGTALLLGVVVLALGGSVPGRALDAEALTVLLLVGAWFAARAARDPLAGTVFAGAAAVYGALAGWYGSGWAAQDAALAVRLACSGMAALAVVCIGLGVVADGALLFVAALTFLLVTGVPVIVVALGGLGAQATAGVALAFTLVLQMFLEMTAFRLSGLTLPLLPGSPDELREDIEPAPHPMVVERGAAAIGYLGALSVGFGAARTVLAVVLVWPGGGWPMALALAVAGALLTRSRRVRTRVARWALLVPAGTLIGAAVVRWAADHDFVTRVEVVVPTLVACGVALVVTRATLPGRRLRPYWGRTVDVLELVIGIGIVPLLFAVLDIYQTVRSLVGG